MLQKLIKYKKKTKKKIDKRLEGNKYDVTVARFFNYTHPKGTAKHKQKQKLKSKTKQTRFSLYLIDLLEDCLTGLALLQAYATKQGSLSFFNMFKSHSNFKFNENPDPDMTTTLLRPLFMSRIKVQSFYYFTTSLILRPTTNDHLLDFPVVQVS